MQSCVTGKEVFTCIGSLRSPWWVRRIVADTPGQSALDAAKAQCRAAALARRERGHPAWGVKLAEHVLRDALPPAGAIVAGFWPLPGEINLLPLLDALHARGFTLCLPVTPARGLPLSFKTWQPGAPLVQARFKTMQPAEGEPVAPDFILTPLLAFDGLGHRLGYGGGYYDRTFATLPHAFRLGCAFAAQACADIPVGPHDLPLHAVATEAGVMHVARG